MRHAFATALLIQFLLASTSAGTVTIQDGTFISANWTLITTGTDATHTITLSQITSGGNPGRRPVLQVGTVDTLAAGGLDIQSLFGGKGRSPCLRRPSNRGGSRDRESS